MSPQFQHAIHEAGNGFAWWASIVVPAIIVWGGTLLRFCFGWDRSYAVGTGIFIAACFAFWIFTVLNVAAVGSVMDQYVLRDRPFWLTEADERAWASDTGRNFAPFTAIPLSILYVGVHHVPARLLLTQIARRFEQRLEAGDIEID